MDCTALYTVIDVASNKRLRKPSYGYLNQARAISKTAQQSRREFREHNLVYVHSQRAIAEEYYFPYNLVLYIRYSQTQTTV